MKLIQSFWSLPCLASSKSDSYELCGGWPNERLHAMSWALSKLTLSKHHPEMKSSLHTDKTGSDWLINKIGLEYDEVIVDFAKLNKRDSKFWALGKIMAYSKQTEPFLHVDSDIYIWEPFDQKIMKKKLIAQNVETGHDIYRKVFDEVKSNQIMLPNFEVDDMFSAVNAGVLGGQDISFFQDYCKVVLDFISLNSDLISKLPLADYYNMFFEQFFFAQMAKQKYGSLNQIGTVLEENKGFLHNVTRFGLVPQVNNYIHMIGQSKANLELASHIEQRLLFEFPEVYKRIDSLYPQCNRSTNHYLLLKNNEKYPFSHLQLETLCHLKAKHSEYEIEEILELNFENPNYNKLWDLYQVERGMGELSKDSLTLRSEMLKDLYQNSVDAFLEKDFVINQNTCEVVFLYGEFEGEINQDVLKTIASSSPYKSSIADQSLHPYLLSITNDDLHITKLKNWFTVFYLLYQRAMKGNEIIAQLLNDSATIKSENLKLGIYEFLTAQCFIYNRIKLN